MPDVTFLPHFLQKTLEVLADHFAVAFVVALILILISFFRQRLIDLSAWFVHISLHGKWDTTLTRKDEREKTEKERDEPEKRHEPAKPHETAQLHQFLTKVWGEIRRKDDAKIRYKVRGRIIGEKLALVYQEIGGFDAGAILLTSKRLMEGFEVACKSDSEEQNPECKPDNGLMYAYPYVWRKREDD